MKSSGTPNVLLSRSFVLSFLSFFFLWISFDFFILFSLYILQKGGDSIDVGIQEAIFFIPSVIVRPLFGWLVDRTGRLKILWAGTMMMVLSSLGFLLLQRSYAETKWWIALVLLMRGSGFAAFYTSFFTFITDHTNSENRGRVIGLFGVSGLVAHGVAPWIGEKVLASYDFNGFFLVSAALAAASLLISAFLKEPRVVRATGHPGHVLYTVAFSRKNLIFIPGAFVFGWVIASFNTFGAPFFETTGGAATVGRFFLAYGIVAAVFRVLFGGIVDRYPRWLLITLFFGLEGIGIVLVVLEPVHYFYLITAAACGVAHAILFPSLSALAIDAHPENRGVVTSIFTAMIELGFSLGSYVLGWIIAISGYTSMFISCAVLALLFAGYVVIAKPRQEPVADCI